MYEVEVKVEAAHAPVEARLDELGAERLGHVRQVDTYYDAPHRDFATTDEALRLREETPATGAARTVLTYKGPLVEAESKTREEAETRVEDPAALRSILDGLGFDPAAAVEKDRERFSLDDYAVTLDAVDDLGEYVEVETEVSTADDVAPARDGARDLLRSLDLDPADQIRTSYLDLQLSRDAEDQRNDSR